MKQREQRKNRSRNEECSFEVVDISELELPMEQECPQIDGHEWQPEESNIKRRKEGLWRL